MRIKTSELIVPALDWAVAQGLGLEPGPHGAWVSCKKEPHFSEPFTPSTKWEQGGPIIEREQIATMFHPEWEVPNWGAWCTYGDDHQEVMGETLLIAAMRCYVASKLGGEVEIPNELC